MINIKNEDFSTKINIAKLKADAQKILGVINYSDFDIGILLTTKTRMQQYNNEYRGKDKPTDVLSFPYHKIKAGERIEAKNPEDKNLGDIILCPEYIKEDLAQWNRSFEERLQTLLVHGICHLLGYDHETDDEHAVMKEQEDYLLSILQK